MSFSRQKKDEIVSVVYQKLFEIVYDNFEAIQDMKDYRLRPGYGYDKFYINKVEGGNECSLQGLIHYILFEDHIYREILNDNQYDCCKELIKNNPYDIYYPCGDSYDDIEVREVLDYIYSRTIINIAYFLISVGFDVKYDFRKYLNVYEREGLE
jgi:hypothetical protein